MHVASFAHPERNVEVFFLHPQSVVADFGAGSGFYAVPLARKVGAEGKVYAFDILPHAVDQIRSNAKMLRLLQMDAVRADLETERGSRLKDAVADFVLVASQVVSRDPVGARSMVSIDKGESFGVSVGNGVLDEYGNLLGIVSEVFSSSSNVLVITDGAVKIDALLLRNNALGVVNGSHGLGLDLDLISQDVQIEKGDRVVTSGLTGEIPAGILIGEIDEIQSSESDLFQSLSIIPAAKTKDFRYVLVVTDF